MMGLNGGIGGLEADGVALGVVAFDRGFVPDQATTIFADRWPATACG